MNNFSELVNKITNTNTNSPFVNAMKQTSALKYTENGAVAYNTTFNKVYDLFAMGGAYRSRSDEDVLKLFKDAYYEDKQYALKCLAYIRDILEGKLVA